MPPVDPNLLMMTGENSFIRLSGDGGGSMSSRLSHWRVLWCPAGAGHALFIQSEITDGEVRVYSDNVAVARWLQNEIEKYLFAGFADTSLPVISAMFSRDGDPRGTVTESIDSTSDSIVMTWYDCMEGFVLTMPPGSNPDRPLGVYSTFFPARSAQIECNGQFAAGTPVLEMRGDRQSSSACLAWSESWLRPN